MLILFQERELHEASLLMEDKSPSAAASVRNHTVERSRVERSRSSRGLIESRAKGTTQRAASG